ncbi:hypothetical protein HYS28_01235 [Candidatus Uhrbacteria bacterium]|nr:hypothetical protein [Candidatus Uhrbacteria bacterium]
MREAALLTALFLVTAVVAFAGVPSLPYPLAVFPLMLVTGLLVMHRVGVGPGVAWLVIGALVLEVRGITPGWCIPVIATAFLAALLVERVFATRSVYALLGLGLVSGLSAVSLFLALSLLRTAIQGAGPTFGRLLHEGAWTFILLLAGLYVGFVTIVTFRSWVQRTFVVR